jgi:hypothetical protein
MAVRKASAAESTDSLFREVVDAAYQRRLEEVVEDSGGEGTPEVEEQVTNSAITWFWRENGVLTASNLANLGKE